MLKFENLDDDVIHANKEWVSFYKGDDSVCIDGTYTLDELRQIVAEVERHLTTCATDGACKCALLSVMGGEILQRDPGCPIESHRL